MVDLRTERGCYHFVDLSEAQTQGRKNTYDTIELVLVVCELAASKIRSTLKVPLGRMDKPFSPPEIVEKIGIRYIAFTMEEL